MTAMQAVWLAGHGGNEVVQVGARPFPSRTAGEVLVRIHAAGLNRVDLYMRNSGAGIRHSLPLVMGLDGAGTVLEAEPGSGFEPADKVVIHPGISCGRCEFCRVGQTVLCTSIQLMGEHIDGTLAEVLTLSPDRADLLRRAPDGAEKHWQANPYWVAVTLYPAKGPVPNYLTLKGEGREVELGAFLTPEERARLAGEVQERLSRLR